jgi:hypothetical protein
MTSLVSGGLDLRYEVHGGSGPALLLPQFLTGRAGASDTSAMTLHMPHLRFSLDPLMAEAKRRARRRRLFLAISVAAGGVAAVTLALHSGAGPGGMPSAKSDVRPPRQTPLPHRVSSIQVIGAGPLSSMTMGVNNVWQGRVGNRWVLAYAGMWNKTSTGDTSAGAYEPAVILYTEPIDPNAPDQYLRRIGVYPTRGSETSVKITAAKGSVLSLTGVGPGSKSGQTFRFNVAMHAHHR